MLRHDSCKLTHFIAFLSVFVVLNSDVGLSLLAAQEKNEQGISDQKEPVADQEPSYDPTADPEYLAEREKRETAFEEASSRFRDALGKQRAIYIRYLNLEDRSPAASDAYFAARQELRERMDEAYEAALNLLRIGGSEESVTFVLTMVQHRLKHDIYDRETLEGATRLIDGGSKLALLFTYAGRAAVVSGEFDMAKTLLEVIDEETLEDADRSLKFFLEEYRTAYEKEMEVREREAEEDRLPRVQLKTTQGDVVIELFLDQAPMTVANFINLVEQGFYDGSDFYQVIDHLLAMTGDPTGLGSGGSGKYIADEHERPDARAALRGSLVMAKLSAGEPGTFLPNSASSQFTILFLPILSATENQTVFGRVIEGMDAISRLQRVDPSKEKKKGALEMPPDRIIEATVIRRPDKLPDPQYRE